MKRKTIRLAASCLLIAAVFVASCAPAVTEEEEVATEEEAEVVTLEIAALPEEEAAPEEDVVTEEEAVPAEEEVVPAEEEAVPAEEEVVDEEGAAPPEEEEIVTEEEEEEVAEEEAYKLQLVSLEVRFTEPLTYGQPEWKVMLFGYVKNISDESLSDVEVVVLFRYSSYQEDGVMASTSILIRENPLAPGETSYFSGSMLIGAGLGIDIRSVVYVRFLELYFRFLNGDIIPAEAVKHRVFWGHTLHID